jgi:acetolactate synthase-1/3 small subunit
MQIVDIFRARIIDVAPKSMIVEVTGDETKIEAIEQLLRPFGIKEMVRTGKVALRRGAKGVSS